MQLGLRLAGALLGLAVCVACGPPYPYHETTYTRTVHQYALVPAPGGPHAVGPQLQRGEVGLEGGFSAHMVRVSNQTRDQGRHGQLLLNKGLRARFAVGAAEVMEIGAGAEVRYSRWGTSLASDVHLGDVDQAVLFQAGPQIRFSTPGPRVRMGASIELAFASLPYRWDVHEKENTDWYPSEDESYSTSKEHTYTKTSSTLYVFARLSLSGTFRVTERVFVQAGAMIHNYPVFFGRRTVVLACSSYDGCHGLDLDDVDPLKSTLMVTPFATVSARLSPHVMLTVQTFIHAFGDEQIVAASRFGGDLALRFSF